MPDCLGKKNNDERCARSLQRIGFCWQHDPLKGKDPGWDIDDNGECTQAEFARFLKVDDSRIYQWRKEGVLSLTENKKIDFMRAVRKLQAHGDPSKSHRRHIINRDSRGVKPKAETDPSEDLSTIFLRAKIAEKEERARLAKIKADEAEGELVEKAPLVRQWYEHTRVTREQLMTVPGRVAGQLAGTSDEREVYRILQAEIRQALTRLADDIDPE